MVPGATTYSFCIDGTGQRAMSIPLSMPPANIVPDLELRCAGLNHEGIAGIFDLVGASVIQRCNKSLAVDGEIRAPEIVDTDALCIDSHRLVAIAKNASSIEYRLWPDNQIKVIQHLTENDSYFVAYQSSGNVFTYGTTAATRPSAKSETIQET